MFLFVGAHMHMYAVCRGLKLNLAIFFELFPLWGYLTEHSLPVTVCPACQLVPDTCLDGRNYSLPPRVYLLLHGFQASNSNFHICKANTFLFIFGFMSFETGFLCSPGLELRDLLTSTSWMLELKECAPTTGLQEPFISPLYVITTFLFSHWGPVRIFLVSGLSTYILKLIKSLI